MTCLIEKICRLGEICSCMDYSAVGHKFNVNESTANVKKVSLNRNTHKTRLYTDWLTKMEPKTCKDLVL